MYKIFLFWIFFFGDYSLKYQEGTVFADFQKKYSLLETLWGQICRFFLELDS